MEINNESKNGTTMDSAAFIPATTITKLAMITISWNVLDEVFVVLFKLKNIFIS